VTRVPVVEEGQEAMTRSVEPFLEAGLCFCFFEVALSLSLSLLLTPPSPCSYTSGGSIETSKDECSDPALALFARAGMAAVGGWSAQGDQELGLCSRVDRGAA
jgi:hypothetical protein